MTLHGRLRPLSAVAVGVLGGRRVHLRQVGQSGGLRLGRQDPCGGDTRWDKMRHHKPIRAAKQHPCYREEGHLAPEAPDVRGDALLDHLYS
jgi:hypothetical protein